MITAVRDVVTASRFRTLDELGDETKGLDRRRVSELLTGRRLPDGYHLDAIVSACTPRPATLEKIKKLYERAQYEAECPASLSGPDPRSHATTGALATPRSSRRPTLPRLVARDPDRESLRPSVLPLMPRLRAIQRELAQGASRPGVTFLVGDGGLGKSVLLGQVLDRIEAGHDSVPQAGVLVSCAAVDQSLATTPDDLDRSLADAAGNTDAGMLDLLRRMYAEHGQVALVIDTLDVLLGDTTFPAIVAFLARALEVAEVLVTCRSYEFADYFRYVRQSAPQLSGSIRHVAIPELSSPEIVAWTQAYLHRSGSPLDADQRSFLESLRGGVEYPGPLRRVCAVPVRLALTCDVFSRTGRVPEDLTVTELYRAYWNERIHHHSGRASSRQAIGKENAAFAAAAGIVSESGRIALRVPKGPLIREHREGVALLVSEGVLRDLDVSLEFFHQTFAEFAHARWALREGPGSPAIATLQRGVVAGSRNLWPVVGSLLLQVEDDGDYQKFADALPAGDPEGARVQVLCALRREAGTPLERVLAAHADASDALAALLPVLAEAPACHLDVAFDAALRALTVFPVQLARPATVTLGALLPRVEPEVFTEKLAAALDAALAIKAGMPLDVWEKYPGTLLDPFVEDGLPDKALAVVWARYRRLESLGRQAALRGFLARPRSSADVAAAADVAFRSRCPPLTEPEQVGFLTAAWESPELRNHRRWVDWRDMLADKLADLWNNAQILLTTEFALRDPVLLDTIVDDLIRGQVTAGELHINVLIKLAWTHAEYIADRLLAATPPTDAIGIGGVADCVDVFAETLDPDRRTRLMRWLGTARAAMPRRVWPAQVVLAARDPDLSRALVAELAASSQPAAVFGGALDAWLHNTPGEVLVQIAPQLRSLLDGTKQRDRRARLEAQLTATDSTARQWITGQMLYGQSPVPAGKALKIVTDALAFGHPADREVVNWLAGLLQSPHTDAVQRLTEALARPESVPNEFLQAALRVPDVVDRMRHAVDRREDGRLIGSLIDLLVRLDRLAPLSSAEVIDVYKLNRRRLPADLGELAHASTLDHSSAVAHLKVITGRLMRQRLSSEVSWALIREVLVDLDPDHLGNKMKKATISPMLVGFGHRDRRSLDWMEDLFTSDGVSAGMQWAIADAILVVTKDTSPGSRAAQLKDDPRCQPSVLAYLLTKLDG